MPFPVAAAIAGGTTLVKGVVNLIKGSSDKKKEAWAQVMSTPAIEQAHQKGFEGLISTAEQRYNAAERHHELTEILTPQTQQRIINKTAYLEKFEKKSIIQKYLPAALMGITAGGAAIYGYKKFVKRK